MNNTNDKNIFGPGSVHPSWDAISRAADVAAGQVLNVKKEERVLIVTNPVGDVDIISRALFDAVIRRGGVPVLMYQPVKSQLDFCEKSIVRAISTEPDVVLSISAEKMGKDEEAIRNPIEGPDGKKYDNLFHYLMNGKKSVRSFWSPGITAEIFEKAVPIDYDRLKRECRKVADVLDGAVSVTVTAPGGTDLIFSVEGRSALVDDGDFSVPGAGGNIPAGETFISPVVGTAEGTIVFDGSLSVYDGVLVLSEPVTCRVEKGFVTDVSGGADADVFRDTLEKGAAKAREFESDGKLPAGQGKFYARNARNIGELGIGLNPAAEIVGNMLVDEKAYRTCHIAVGSNYDDDADALIHLDGLIHQPTVTAVDASGQRTTLVDKGDLVL